MSVTVFILTSILLFGKYKEMHFIVKAPFPFAPSNKVEIRDRRVGTHLNMESESL
jgi:hypothetical protein